MKTFNEHFGLKEAIVSTDSMSKDTSKNLAAKNMGREGQTSIDHKGKEMKKSIVLSCEADDVTIAVDDGGQVRIISFNGLFGERGNLILNKSERKILKKFL